MKPQNKITFLGGDARQEKAALRLAESGYSVYAFAGCPSVSKKINLSENIGEAIKASSAVILPLPSSVDGSNLNAPSYDLESIRLDKIIDLISVTDKDILLIGGRIPKPIIEHAEQKGLRVIDYFASESFQIKNAYITAEAAVSIAMNNMKKSIRGAKFAITGFGRIAKTLSTILIKLGGEVCVLARKKSDLVWAELEGARGERICPETLKKACEESDMIFNTVPEWLFYEDELLRMGNSTQIVDLASSPGGVDLSAAKRLGSKVLWASSLPGKYAPESAGDLIAECIEKILTEEGV